jgi:uroporphyrin-III C-methyltransferase
LAKHQIGFAIVPGITAASGASAYAGIPLTHRDCAQSVRFVTAHLKSEKDEPNWADLVPLGNNKGNYKGNNKGNNKGKEKRGETLVFYMGLQRLDIIMQRLQQYGLAQDMPVAVIDQATSRQQQVCVGSAKNIALRVANMKFNGPAVIIVGEVVSKRHQVALELLNASFTCDKTNTHA